MNYKFTVEELENLSKDIWKILHLSGGKFGDTNITTSKIIYLSLSDAMVDIANYCSQYNIEITKLERIKLLAFAIPHLRKRDTGLNIERYIFSIFIFLKEAYKSKFNIDDLKPTISVCNNLIYAEPSQYLIVYGYIKGFQECLSFTHPK